MEEKEPSLTKHVEEQTHPGKNRKKEIKWKK